MKLSSLYLLSSILCLLLTGCIVPANTITIGGVRIRAPKDVVIENLEALKEGDSLTITVGRLSSTNNPDVIDKGAAGTAAIIKATAEAITTVGATAAKP